MTHVVRILALFTLTTLIAFASAGHTSGSRPDLRRSVDIAIPPALREEHLVLVERLEEATRVGGKTGAAALELKSVLLPHLEKEEEFAMPELGALGALARHEKVEHLQELAALGRKLKKMLPEMLEEHRAIADKIHLLAVAAGEEKQDAAMQFAIDLKHHAEIEEQVLYPAAILVGEMSLRRR